MKVTYNWLKDFVEIKISAEILADKLTMAGLEVTSLEKREGDFIFEIEVTSNRPDCLSVIGIAREAAAITNSKLKTQNSKLKLKTQNLKEESLKIEIQNKKDCPLYTAKIIRDVKVAPSPEWLKKRLEMVGCRSVNNIVDITNYILFETGEPLHAFDLDKLSKDIVIVRRGRPEEDINTIDGTQKKLNPDILIISDKEEPVAIAGVMGGKKTEVTPGTKNILLEAAIFNPIIVRHGRQKLGLSSESSYRFERGIDVQVVEKASLRAAELIQKIAGGKCILAKSSGIAKPRTKFIGVDIKNVNRILGIEIKPAKIKAILNGLEFKTQSKAKDMLKVSVPSHRQDINSEIDLIEEIARIYGYTNIPESLPKILPEVSTGQVRDLVSLVKHILVGLGLNEVITYSLVDRDLLKNFSAEGPSAIEIQNPLSKEQEVLRPLLLPSLASCVAYNLNQKQEYINIFEIAKVFGGQAAQPKEALVLGIALCGTKTWLLESGLVKDEAGFLHLKGILEVLFERLGIKHYGFNQTGQPAQIAIDINQQTIGCMLKLSRPALDAFDIKNKEVYCLEVSLEKMLPFLELKRKFIPPPRYPGITRDISFILKEDISLGDVLRALEERGQPLLCSIKIVDYYKGKQIPPGTRGLTISCLYRSDERTLTEAEINPIHGLLSDALTERFGAKIR